jgi:DNA-binding NarL/FixJ family response regulator
MPNNAHVVIVEDDYYARHWMEMLLRRDWRTRVVKQVGSPVDLFVALADLDKHNKKVDIVLIDTDIPLDDNWLNGVMQKLADYNASQFVDHEISKQKYTPPVMLFTGVNPNHKVSNLFRTPGFGGYILKDEIRYSLAWAVILAVGGKVVITPGVLKLINHAYPFPAGSLILDGRKPIPFVGLSDRETRAARLAILFSMERRELANELMITEDYSYGLISSIFEKIGLNDVLNGCASPELYFGEHPAVMIHLNAAIKSLKKASENNGRTTKSKTMKVKGKETLAFHLLTLPHIEEIY